MKQEDNIKKFFEKRLQDTTPGDDLWNVPSDDIWNAAKVHFPKEKKKKRPFIFFVFGLGILLVSIGLVTYGLTRSETGLAEKTNLGNEVENQRLAESKDISENNLSIEKQKETASVKNNQTTDSSRSRSPITKESEKENFVNNNSEIKTLPISEVLEKEQTIEDEKEGLKIEKTKIAIARNTTKDSVAVFEKDFKDFKDFKELKRTGTGLSLLPGRLSSLEFDSTKQDFEAVYRILKSKRNFHRWEVGLSHSPFIINIKKALVEGDDLKPEESLDVGFRYRNINVPVTRWFNPKWSLTSGLSVSSLELGIAFRVEEIYDFVPTDVELRQVFDENTLDGDLIINDISRDIDIVFTDDANLENGDTLFIEGNVPLELNIAQVPIVLNYHFGKGKLEGLIHTGIAIDYLNTKLINLDFDIYKNSNLINEPINFESINEYEFGLSLYLGVGLKYHLSDKINIGLSTKLDFTELVLSRHEVGVYYGF